MDRLVSLLKRCTGTLAAALVVVVSACSTNPAPTAYAEDFAQAREAATSDFERQALADDEITREEYEEAMQRYVSCLEDAGVSVHLQDNYGYYSYQVSGDLAKYDELAAGCALGTTAWIEGLYVDSLSNPEKLHPYEAIARCLVGVGLVEEPFGQAEYEQLLASAGVSTFTDSDPDVPIDPTAVEILNHEYALGCEANQQFHRTLNEGS